MLRRVHFFEPATFAVLGAWLNDEALAVVRPFDLSPAVADGLCERCARKALDAGCVPDALAVRLLDGSRLLVLGDGERDDGLAVRRARRLARGRARCEREQHDDGPSSAYDSPAAEERRRSMGL